ncbi:threonine-phosphate decarboxylase CobD [Paludibacterium yongneupense]|uniref:threonine-phosphate decarboxylase CobD n=1 Tax=Paludibacterium yongneupense TaxID=400061 RepID=UPI000424A502|nr:threonine-phosphate decarboxylase CobD [Paludibacterium yongneupense]
MLDHGGGVLAAARRYGIAVEDWLDLSTGLNPQGWPVAGPGPADWQRLPQEDDGLESAAAGYYGSDILLPVAGSQAAIQALPGLRPPGVVGMLATSYAEHARAWQRHGHRVETLEPDALEAALPRLDALVLCTPNNPTGWRPDAARLALWREQLTVHGGWLLLDEAFMDGLPQHSQIAHTGRPGLIVLRSIGKFFGLAGARVGFVFAWRELLDALREELGPWTLSGPARAVARAALLDTAWQDATRTRLQRDSARLGALLAGHGLAPRGGTDLFQWLPHPQSLALHDFFARRGILCRHFPQSGSLRFGHPPDENGWQRLAHALAEWRPDERDSHYAHVHV